MLVILLGDLWGVSGAIPFCAKEKINVHWQHGGVGGTGVRPYCASHKAS